MSRIHWLIVASLGLNLVLGLGWYRTSPRTPRTAEASAGNATALGATPPPEAAPPPARPAEPVEAGSGAAVPANDLADVHRELVAAGYPRALIVRIIWSLAHQRVSDWFASLHSAKEASEYWKPPQGGVRSGTPQMREYMQLLRNNEQQLVSLLGPAYLDELEEHAASLRHEFGPLSAEKLAQVQLLQLDLRERLYGPPTPGSSETDEQREHRVQEEHRAALAKILSPQELLEYELRQSRTAHAIRRDYFTAELSEDEYRRLFQLIRPLETQLGTSMGPTTGEAAWAAREQADATLLQQLKGTFGPQRAAELALVRDPSARQERELVGRLNLPLSAAAELITIRNDIQGRVKGLHENSALTDDQRRTRTSELLAEAERRFTATLGADGFSLYREFGGQWMKRVSGNE